MSAELHQKLTRELGRTALPWESSRTIEWLPIMNFEKARIYLGLSRSAGWIRATQKAVSEFQTGVQPVFLLPILEIPTDEFIREIKKGLHAKDLSEDFLSVLPIDDVVVTGLTNQSEHWTGLALNWASKISRSPKIKAALQEVVANGSTQKLRHQAKKLLADEKSPG